MYSHKIIYKALIGTKNKSHKNTYSNPHVLLERNFTRTQEFSGHVFTYCLSI